MSERTGFWSRNIWIIVAWLVVAAATVVAVVSHTGRASELNASLDRQQAARAQVIRHQGVYDDTMAANTMSGLGMNRTRIAADRYAISGFVELVLTWSSTDELDHNRQRLTERYDAAGMTTVIATFLPSDQKQKAYLDHVGMSSALSGLTVVPTGVTDGHYRYTVAADVDFTAGGAANSTSDASSQSRRQLFDITMDQHSRITEVTGIAAAAISRDSN